MLITQEAAADYIGVTISNLRTNKKTKNLIKDGKFDMTAYQAELSRIQEKDDFCFDILNLCDFVIEQVGTTAFYNNFKGKERVNLRQSIKICSISLNLATVVENRLGEEWRALYEKGEEKRAYIPFSEREPLTRSFLIWEYWSKKKSPAQIAKSLNVPESWVCSEISRLGLQKSKNGIKKKGKKGYVMPTEQRKKHQNQPHAKAVVQICPETFEIVKEYNSTGAVERYGFLRDNVRRAIKRADLSKGFLWSYKGFEKVTIDYAVKKGNLKSKLQATAYKKPTKKQLKSLYIDANMTLEECAKHFKCHPGTMAVLAMNYGLKKRGEKISVERLRDLYIEEGLSAKEIAEMHGYSTSSIRTYLSKSGLSRKVDR